MPPLRALDAVFSAAVSGFGQSHHHWCRFIRRSRKCEELRSRYAAGPQGGWELQCDSDRSRIRDSGTAGLKERVEIYTQKIIKVKEFPLKENINFWTDIEKRSRVWWAEGRRETRTSVSLGIMVWNRLEDNRKGFSHNVHSGAVCAHILHI